MDGMGSQTIEDFWGAELSSKQKQVQWQAEEDEEDEDMDGINLDRVLELRQACLGASAKQGERNIVQVTAENDEGETVKHTILSLSVGVTEQCSLFLTLHPPLTFELVSGSGPVHIVGSSVETFNSLDDFDSSSDEDGEEDELSVPEVKALLNSAAKKRPATSPSIKPAKQMKLDKSGGESTVDTSMDTSGSIVPSKPSKKKPLKQVKPIDDEDDDEEEEDSEDEDDDDDEDDDEEESDEEEEEEEEVKPPSKKPQSQTGGKPKQKIDIKSKLFKTPQHTKPSVKPTKGTVSAPTTPKQSEKKGGMKGALDLDEAKKRLLKQLPNVPKKLEKFNNFVGNSFKIKEDSAKKQLWEFVQKNRA